MERNINIINENILPSISNKNNIRINGAFDLSNNKNDTSMNDHSPLNNTKNNYINLIPKNKRKISKNKVDYTNSSFLTLRKNSEISPKKKNDGSVTINENNINFISMSNLSNTNLMNNKNESIFRKLNIKENIKDENIKDKEKESTMNQINNIYDNNIKLKLRLNKDEIIHRNKVSNKLINRNFEKNKNFPKIKKNYYTLIKSRTFNDKKSSDINKNNSSKILQLFCFICNTYDERLYHARNCKHFFCDECGKAYFDQQVKKGIYTLECPKYNCFNNLNLNNIKDILSRETYIKLDTYQRMNNNLNKLTSIKINEKLLQNLNTPKSMKRNSFETISNNGSYKGLNCFKKNFLKIPHDNKYKNKNNNIIQRTKHILKIDNTSHFKNRIKLENEKNKNICLKCKNPSLFKRDDLTYIKCLNCDNVFCKYCFKRFNTSKKFLRRNVICSVCYQRKKKRRKASILAQIKIEILLVFSGFFAVIYGFSRYEAQFIFKKRRKCHFLHIIFFVIIFFVNFIVAILFFPYFPVFTMIFG